jgi:hypothetical protein
MKKLMIAAAAAAMIGGVFAEGYDFTASVKTTKGKEGSAKTTYRVGVGQDDTGNYWWKDLGFTTEKEAKQYVKKLSNDDKAAFALINLGFVPGVFDNYPTSANKSVDGTTDYNHQEHYKNKWQWCYTFKFTVKDEDCYRVPGSAKLKGIVVMDECCDVWEFVDYDFGTTILADDAGDGIVEIAHPLLYRIGGVSLSKANKVEVTGTFGDAQGYVGNVIGSFAYAGQGSYDVKNGRITKVSGNIVGVLENPDCEECCDDNQLAIVFECEDDDDWLTSYQDDDAQIVGTAAFGTFSLKYNKKY